MLFRVILHEMVFVPFKKNYSTLTEIAKTFEITKMPPSLVVFWHKLGGYHNIEVGSQHSIFQYVSNVVDIVYHIWMVKYITNKQVS